MESGVLVDAPINSHRDLVVWQRAVQLSLDVYAATKCFPDAERFGLTNQLRRASVSIASNIAEGYGRGSTSDYVRFLRNARGSLYEIDTQLLIASRLEYLAGALYEGLLQQVNECGRVLAGLIRSIDVRE